MMKPESSEAEHEQDTVYQSLLHRQRPGGRSAKVHAAVLQATGELLLEQGYAQLRIGDVAQRAGVHETSIYRRWKTKAMLVADTVLALFDQHVPNPDTGAFRDDVLSFLPSLVRYLQSPEGAALSRACVDVSNLAEAAEARQAVWGIWVAQFAVLVERAIGRGELPAATNAQIFLEMLIGPFFLRLLVTGEPFGEDMATQVIDLLLHN
ncbi:TetR/AcrR family transcriptional regulator [Herpetosiphon llansteffanensis]